MAPEGLPDPVRVALAVTRILERLGASYVTAGSFASSLHGEPRSTDDIDIVADLRSSHAADLLAALRDGWYVDAETVRAAVSGRGGGSFNAIHLATGVKVDLFVVGGDSFDRQRVTSGQTVSLGPGAELRVDTAEYTVLRKLEWFRRRGETSDRQWRDVLGILRTQGARLDQEELSKWAGRLGVTDLLARAMEAAGVPRG